MTTGRRTRSRRIRRGGSAICQVGVGSDDNLSIGGSLTNRWLVTLGIGTLLFGLSLFVLRVPIRTIIIFFALGIPVVSLWLYGDENSRRRSKQIDDFNKTQQQACACNFCKHDLEAVCIENRCPCCITMKGNKIVGILYLSKKG